VRSGVKTPVLIIVSGLLIFLSASFTYAENIDPDGDGSQYAYGGNIGWLNFEPNIAEPSVGVTVTSEKLTGFAWAENIGWINLDPNDEDPDSGVKNDGTGLLTGFAWGENVGWINFNPKVPGDANHYGVTIDGAGDFDGWGWGENIGWISFNSAELYGYNVKVCKVSFEDLADFVDDWLEAGLYIPADLDDSNDVDFIDYGIFADYWLGYCPDDWPLRN
jgi:hypothetical protein